MIRPGASGQDEPGKVSLRWEIVKGEAVLRSEQASPGDRLVVEASSGGAVYAEVRIYRRDVEAATRAASGGGGVVKTDYVFPSRGRNQVVLLWSDSPLPGESTGSLDSDLSAAISAGAKYEMREIDVL